MLLPALDETETIELRHLKIGQHDVHRVGPEMGERPLAVSCVRDVPTVLRFEHVSGQRTVGRRVVDDEDVRHGCPPTMSSP